MRFTANFEGAWAQEGLMAWPEWLVWCPWGSCQGLAKQRALQYINPAHLPVQSRLSDGAN